MTRARVFVSIKKSLPIQQQFFIKDNFIFACRMHKELKGRMRNVITAKISQSVKMVISCLLGIILLFVDWAVIRLCDIFVYVLLA